MPSETSPSPSYQNEGRIRNWIARTVNSQRLGSAVHKQLPRLPLNRWVGWQFTVVCGCVWTIFALICNIVLLSWASRQSRSDTRNYLLHEGDCDDVRTIDVWSHLGINILSTIILGFSNYAMQVLVAPTRKNIDNAHLQGRYVIESKYMAAADKYSILDIGISGFGNWRFMCWRRKAMYLTLVLTSLPLHLLYAAPSKFYDNRLTILATTQSCFRQLLLSIMRRFLYHRTFSKRVVDSTQAKAHGGLVH